ncbi:MAG: amidohydrolase family protein [Thermoplasmata archaeon]
MNKRSLQSNSLSIINVNIFTSKSKEVIKNGIIVIEEGKIKEIGKQNEINIPENSRIIDTKHKYALPGLIDSHLHIDGFKTGDTLKESLLTPIGVRFARGIKDLQYIINSGFTSIVDAGGIIGLHLRDAVNENTILGPRIFAAGYFLTPTFGHGDIHYLPTEYVDVRTSKFMNTQEMTSLLCDGTEECRKAARYALRENPDFIKVMATGGVLSQKDRPEYRGFTLKELKAIVDETKATNKFVHAHAQGKDGILNSIKAGVKVIAHGIYIDDETSSLAAKNNVIVIPTFSILYNIVKNNGNINLPEWALKKAEEVYDISIENIKKAKRIGVKLATGTDFSGANFCPHGTNAQELKLFVKNLGMTPSEAIISATRISSEVTGQSKYLGTIEKDKFADLIILKENPMENIDILLDPNNIEVIIKNGEVVKLLQ